MNATDLLAAADMLCQECEQPATIDGYCDAHVPLSAYGRKLGKSHAAYVDQLIINIFRKSQK